MPPAPSLESASGHPTGAPTQIYAADWLIADLAERQHGVVARRQLLELGVERRAIAGRAARGTLHRLHPGIYAVGHPAVSHRGKWMAGVLAGGEAAVLSHRSAAALWSLQAAVPPHVEITTPHSSRSFGWLRRHCGQLPEDEVTLHQGIPVTTVSRMLFDLAACVDRREFERAIREAEFLRLPERPPLVELLARHPRRHGTRLVRATVERLQGLATGVTRSSLEDRFLRLAAKADLPMPETNVTLWLDGRRYDADCLWRTQRLILELDGHQAHGTRSAFESDRERDRHLQAAGWRVVRATWHQVSTATTLTRDLRRLLCTDELRDGTQEVL